MAKYEMNMVLEYAKVFKENVDMGLPDGPRVAQAIYAFGGQYIVNGYFTDQSQIDQLLEEGMDPMPMNNPRVLSGNEDFGIGKFMKIKVKVTDPKTFTDSKTGEPVTIDYGGTPKVVDLREGRENKRMWSYEDDGALGNGTKAVVMFETYKQGVGIRLSNIGVTELVPWENMAPDSVDPDEIPF
jgi:hypothetical protein